MKLPRVSIKRLMAIIGLIAVVLAALAHPNNGWVLILAPTYIVLLLTAILGCILCRGPRRAGWMGFALFGWSYFLAMSFGWTRILNSTDDSPFGFSIALDLFFELLTSVSSCDREKIGDFCSELVEEDNLTTIRISLILMGLFFALLGAWIARFLFRQENAAASRSPTSDGEHRDR